MNLWEIQPFVASTLRSNSLLSGIPVLEDDGTYPKIPNREQSLRNHGLLLLVWQIECEGLLDVTNQGTALESVAINIVIEEAVTVCRSTGVNITAEKAVQYVLQALSGVCPIGNNKYPILPMNPAWKNFGTVDGVQRFVVSFTIKHPIIPTR